VTRRSDGLGRRNLNRERIARELLRLAKGLLADGRIEITITVPTNADYWGSDATDAEAKEVAQHHLDKLVDWAKKEWRGSKVDGELVPQTQSRNNKTKAEDRDGDRDDIVESIGIQSERTMSDDMKDVLG